MAFFIHTFFCKRGGIFLPALLASYFFLSCRHCTLAHRVALLFVRDHEFLLALLIKYSFQGYKTGVNSTSKSVIHLVRYTVKIRLLEEEKYKRGRPQALCFTENNTEFSASTSTDKFSFLVIFLPVREPRLVHS